MDKERIRREARLLFSDRIWLLDDNSLSNARKRIVNFIKIIRITFDTFAENRMGFQCVALSYFVTLALIPMIALIFVVTGGLGLTDKISQLAFNVLPDYPEIVSLVIEKAGNIIDVAKGGVVGLISALMFLWTILWMMFQVERVFNNIWGIRKIPRKIYKRFSVYLLFMILLPFIIIIFGLGIALYSNLFSLIGLDLSVRELSAFVTILGWLVFLVITVFTLSVMYKFIPATDVKYRHAFRAAVVGGCIFTVFQYLYLETQVFVSRLNGTYGVIAAIPLFLIWMNFSWQIIMYGAELSYGLQNLRHYRIPEGRVRDMERVTFDSIEKEDESI